jgi:hypothetical protein
MGVVMNKTHIRAYTKAMHEVGVHTATALEIELAIGLAVMHETSPSKRLGRETLLTIYAGAGWQCDKPGALDWRKVNRHITASIALYDKFMENDVAELATKHKAGELVDALRPMIKALKVKSVNEVLLACEKVRPPRKPTPHVEGQRIDAGHLHLVVPKSATREDMLALATKLMELAMTKFEQPAAAEAADHEALTGEPVEA